MSPQRASSRAASRAWPRSWPPGGSHWPPDPDELLVEGRDATGHCGAQTAQEDVRLHVGRPDVLPCRAVRPPPGGQCRRLAAARSGHDAGETVAHGQAETGGHLRSLDMGRRWRRRPRLRGDDGRHSRGDLRGRADGSTPVSYAATGPRRAARGGGGRRRRSRHRPRARRPLPRAACRTMTDVRQGIRHASTGSIGTGLRRIFNPPSTPLRSRISGTVVSAVTRGSPASTVMVMQTSQAPRGR